MGGGGGGVDEGRKDPNTTISGSSSARQRNVILRAVHGPALNAGFPPPPPLDPRMLAKISESRFYGYTAISGFRFLFHLCFRKIYVVFTHSNPLDSHEGSSYYSVIQQNNSKHEKGNTKITDSPIEL